MALTPRKSQWLITLALAAIAIMIPDVANAAATARSAYSDLDTCIGALRQPSPAPLVETPESLRILSWNTMKYGRDGSLALLKRLSSNADFVFIQEGLHSVAPSGSYRGERYFGEGYANRRKQSGVELRSRLPAHFECRLQFIEPWLRTPKAVLATRHALGERGLLLVNLHAVNFTIGVGAYAAQLEAVAAMLRSHGGPAIVAGDFNNWNSWREAVLRRFAEENDLAVANFQPDWRSRHLGRPVDGVLQRGFETISATAVPTRVSDHHPLLLLLVPARAPQLQDPRP